MTIVDLKPTTHKNLKQVKEKMKKINKPIYKINNDVVINHALTKIKENEFYEITNVD